MPPASAPGPAQVPLRRGQTASEAREIRVLICDDSAVIRTIMGQILEEEGDIKVVARATNGEEALLAAAASRPDLVLLDIEMPVMDGMTALPLLLQAHPDMPVVMASTLTTRGAEIGLRALRMGAAETLAKPAHGEIHKAGGFAMVLRSTVRALARRHRPMRNPARPPPNTAIPPAATPAPLPAGTVLAPAPRRAPKLLAIGSSTGGPNAIISLVQALGQRLPVPLVLTQHMPAHFLPILARHIDALGVMPCRVAEDGAVLSRGEILLAPGDRHLLVQNTGSQLVARLSDTPPENFCRPAVDPMLRSATTATGGALLAVILTGMGQDGLDGARGLAASGGAILAQDEASSVVWGMPGAVVRAGLAHAVLAPDGLARKILSLLTLAPAGAA